MASSASARLAHNKPGVAPPRPAHARASACHRMLYVIDMNHRQARIIMIQGIAVPHSFQSLFHVRTPAPPLFRLLCVIIPGPLVRTRSRVHRATAAALQRLLFAAVLRGDSPRSSSRRAGAWTSRGWARHSRTRCRARARAASCGTWTRASRPRWRASSAARCSWRPRPRRAWGSASRRRVEPGLVEGARVLQLDEW